MPEEINNPMSRPWFYLIRGTIIFVFFYILKIITVFSVRRIYVGHTVQLTDFPVWAVNLISAVIIVFIYNSIVNLFSMHDKSASVDFFEEEKEDLFFLEEIGVILKDKKFWIETLTAITLCTVVAFIGGFSEVTNMLPEAVVALLPLWLLPVLLCTVVFFTVSLLCKYEARRYWLSLKREHETDKIGKAYLLIIRSVVFFIIYPGIFPYAPYIVLAGVSFVMIFVAASKEFTVIGLILIIAILIGVVVLLRYLRSIRKRKHLIKKLIRVAEENGYTISEIYFPYASFFRHVDGYNFTLKKGDRAFSCRFVGTVKKSVPVVFTSATEGYYLHRIGTKKHNISLHHKFNYGFETDKSEIKIVLVDPFPKTVLVESDGGSRRLYSGDKIWNVIIYDSADIIGAIDRDCLGRYNGRYD